MSRRLFYAIEFPDDVRSRVAEASQVLAQAARQGRWTCPDNLHLTLQFLGECPDDWLPDLLAILRQSAACCAPFSLRIRGCGTFGRSQDILWLGVEAGPQLYRLAEGLTDQLRRKSLPYEERGFSAHITVGRQVRIDPEYLRRWNWPAIDLQVGQISLMESTRADNRLTYLALQREQLTGALLGHNQS